MLLMMLLLMTMVPMLVLMINPAVFKDLEEQSLHVCLGEGRRE